MSLEIILDRFIGKQFPTKEDTDRLDYILTRERLFKGENSTVFFDALITRLCSAGVSFQEFLGDGNGSVIHSANSSIGKSRVEAMLRSYNLLKPICSVKNRFLFGKELIVKDINDERNAWINGTDETPDDGFVDRTSLYTELYRSGLGGQYRGDSILRLWKNEDGQAEISVVSAKYWFPVSYVEDSKKVLANCIVEQYKGRDEDKIYKVIASEKGTTYYFAILSKDGNNTLIPWNEASLGKLPSSLVGSEIEYVNKEVTDLDYGVIFRIPTIPQDDSVYGTTDFDEACISELREIFIRMTQNSRIADKNTDPLMTGSASAIKEDEYGNTIVEMSGKFHVIDKDDAPTTYVEFGGAMLDKSTLIIKEAIETIYGMTNVNASALGSTQESMSALTGTAIEKVYATPISEGNRQWQLWRPVISNMLKCARQMEKGVNDLNPQLERESGLPKTDMETLEITLAKNGKQPVISHLESIKKANVGISDKQANIEYDRILKEQVDREGISPINANEIDFGV